MHQFYRERKQKSYNGVYINKIHRILNAKNKIESVLSQRRMEFHKIIQDEDNIRLNFRNKDTHDFITSLSDTQLNQIESLDCRYIEANQYTFNEFVEFNAPTQLEYLDVWNT